MDHTIGIMMPVFNEATHIKATIESLLSQTHQNWVLYISDNHSVDGTTEIVRQFADHDQRIMMLKPDLHCSASFDHIMFLRQHILSDQRTLFGIILLGGHDLISPDYIEALLLEMLRDPSCALAYPLDAYSIDEKGGFKFKYRPMPQTFGQDDSFQPLTTLLSMVYCIPIFGLTRYMAWKEVPPRHKCTGFDHFLIAEYSLKGNIKGVGKAILQARNPTNELKIYQAKHFGGDLNPCTDMLRQLNWLHHVCNQAFSNYPEVEKNSIFASISTMYILKFFWIFNNKQEAKDQFLALPEINNLIATQNAQGAALAVLTSQIDVASS